MFNLYIIQSDESIAWLWSCHVWSLCDSKHWKSTKVSILPTTCFWGGYTKNFLKNSNMQPFQYSVDKKSLNFDLLSIWFSFWRHIMKYYWWRHQWRHWWKPSNLSQQKKEKHYQEGNNLKISTRILIIFKWPFIIENVKNYLLHRRIFIWDSSHFINFSRKNYFRTWLGIFLPKYQVISITKI